LDNTEYSLENSNKTEKDKKEESDLVRTSKENEINELISYENKPVMRAELRGLMLHMPDSVRRTYGCMNCEWRGTELCPSGFKRGRPKDESERCANWICPFRASYLAGFVRECYPLNGCKSITISMWRKAILTSTTHVQQMKELFKFEQLQDKLEDLEDDLNKLKESGTEEEVLQKEEEWEKLLAKVDYARNNWTKTTNMLMFYNAKDLDREIPKKQEITTINVNPSDIARMIRNAEKKTVINQDDIIDGELNE